MRVKCSTKKKATSDPFDFKYPPVQTGWSKNRHKKKILTTELDKHQRPMALYVSAQNFRPPAIADNACATTGSREHLYILRQVHPFLPIRPSSTVFFASGQLLATFKDTCDLTFTSLAQSISIVVPNGHRNTFTPAGQDFLKS